MSDTELIKEKLDIVDFISEYTPLKPAGVNHKGLCPFHQEKTPSFMASRERRGWHCFGCNKGGDIFTFVEEIEGMEFREALNFLANKAGVTLTNTFSDRSKTSERERLKEIIAEAARFFHAFLLRMDAAKPAREYLAGRGVKQETIEEWQIGFIPDQWGLLTQYLLKKGFGVNDLISAGMTIQRDGASGGMGIYDRFRGRIMFPLHDVHGTIVGFSGRILETAATKEQTLQQGKYINTPQTPLYDKSRLLFGLSKAKRAIREQGTAVLVEGQMDVITAHQAGFVNVIATSGTALTEHHIELLKRYTETLRMAFDADEAGQKAAKRGIDMARKEGLRIKVIAIPDGKGKDPDECIQRFPEVWKASVEQAKDIMEWYINRAFHGKDAHDPAQKQALSEMVLQEIARIPFAIERDHWITELANRFGVEPSVLREDLQRFQPKHSQTKKSPSAPQANQQKNEAWGRLPALGERLVIITLCYPALFKELPPLDLYLSTWSPNIRALYELCKKQYTLFQKIKTAQLAQDAPSSLVEFLITKGTLDPTLTKENAEAELRSVLDQMKADWTRYRRTALEKEIRHAEEKGDKEAMKTYIDEFRNL